MRASIAEALRNDADGRTKVGLARAVGLTPSSITKWLDGSQRIRQAYWRDIERYLNWPEGRMRELAGADLTYEDDDGNSALVELKQVNRRLDEVERLLRRFLGEGDAPPAPRGARNDPGEP